MAEARLEFPVPQGFPPCPPFLSGGFSFVPKFDGCAEKGNSALFSEGNQPLKRCPPFLVSFCVLLEMDLSPLV